MKQKLKKIIIDALDIAHKNGALPLFNSGAFNSGALNIGDIEIEEPKNAAHGDFASNAAMKTASLYKMPPRKIAEALLSNIQDPEGIIEKSEIAGPGFINFFIAPKSWYPVLKQIHEQGDKYGSSNFGKNEKIQIEFVSANPTGPLHVGHGRGAAVGDSLANILTFCGFNVQKEYYINDSGRQIKTLGRSVFLRYKGLFIEEKNFPEDCYQGGYIIDLAKEIKAAKNDSLLKETEEAAISFCAKYAALNILENIKYDLIDFGVKFDLWFSEQTLYDKGKIDSVIKSFQEKKVIYENDGALWFKTTSFGDEKDRVVVRQNGITTYFASDLAYHQNKYERGFTKIINIWGADHHGYIPRMKALVEVSGYNKDSFNVILIQLVNLLREGAPVAMSTRAGEFVTLSDVIKEVGKDAARFLFLTRHHESPLDFDLELAKKKSAENPVYYVQYVHARIYGIYKNFWQNFRRKKEEDSKENELIENFIYNDGAISLLTEPEEIGLIKSMSKFQYIIKTSAELMEPHRLTFYLMELASQFHTYYNKHKILTDDIMLTNARIYLAGAVKIIIKTGLNLLGVEAPERM